MILNTSLVCLALLSSVFAQSGSKMQRLVRRNEREDCIRNNAATIDNDPAKPASTLASICFNGKYHLAFDDDTGYKSVRDVDCDGTT